MATNRQTPAVSLAIPVYNGERFLARAVDACLAQDFEDFELVISDNGSTDLTPEICQDYAAKDPRVRVFRSERTISAWRNYNRVFDLSSGEYFKWIAHDDWMASEFLGQAVAELRSNPSAVLTTCPLIYTGDDGEFDRVVRVPTKVAAQAASSDPRVRFRAVIRSFADISASTFGLIRSAALLETGLIRNASEPDRILVGELCLLGPFRYLPSALLFRYLGRDHADRDSWTWLDPANAQRAKMATPRFLYYHLAAINRAEVKGVDKTLLAAELVGGSALARTRYKFRAWLRERR
jgi:glycosyltransferase involved in cell wall biosynthesis